jgi:UDP-glucuronate decarboxylase
VKTVTCDLSEGLEAIRRNLGNPDYRGFRFLVTGGAGFLGTWLCSFLVSKGADVLCLDNLSSGLRENVSHLEKNPRFSFILHDISEPIHITQNIDYVLHLASRASPLEFDKFPLEIIRANTLGTIHALDIATEHGARLLYTSTSEVYGNAGVFPTPESYHGNVNTLGIRGCYDESKRMGEAICLAYLREKGTDVRIARIFNTYGPLMRADGVYGRVIPRLISQAQNSTPMTIFGDGSQTRSFCYVTDQVEGLLKLLHSDSAKGEVVNIGNDKEITILSLADLIRKRTGSNSAFAFEPLPEDDPVRRWPDISKAKTLLQWRPKVDIETGIASMIHQD